MKCRICGSRGLTEYLNLGEQPLADAFLTREQFETEAVFPLTVLYCNNCSLSQLSYVVPPEILYNKDYPYETAVNFEGVHHFTKMAVELEKRYKPKFVVDIGSNDGTLLSGFDCKTCGIEPVKEISVKAGVYTINDFFGSNSVDKALVYGGKADIVTACNIFAHVDNLHGFMWNLDRLLKINGLFIIEAPYLPDMIDNLAFDSIYHEHLSYLSIKPLMHLFREYGMEIFHCTHHDIHCGTMRYFVARKNFYKFTRAVDLWYESEQKYHDIEKLKESTSKFFRYFFKLVAKLLELKSQQKKIVGVSAPAKGNTFLNMMGRNASGVFDYITEKSERKIGKFTPGTHIPVVSDERLIRDQPDYALILAHNWEKQIKRSLRDYKGEWIDAKRLKDLCGRPYRAGRECDCSGACKEGIQECCGLSC